MRVVSGASAGLAHRVKNGADAEKCDRCADIEAVPFLKHRRKGPEGSFSREYLIEAKYCPECGRALQG